MVLVRPRKWACLFLGAGMSRVPTNRCRVCEHPDRARIELQLANGVAIAKAARQFGVSRDSAWRHWGNHVQDDRKASLRVTGISDPKVDLEALKRIESESLLSNLITERVRLQRIADLCEKVGNYQDATRSSAAVVKVLALAATYLGELRTGNTTINNNFLLSPDWIQLRRVIVASLRPFPEAQRALLSAVREHESATGVEVTHARAVERGTPALLEHEVGA